MESAPHIRPVGYKHTPGVVDPIPTTGLRAPLPDQPEAQPLDEALSPDALTPEEAKNLEAIAFRDPEVPKPTKPRRFKGFLDKFKLARKEDPRPYPASDYVSTEQTSPISSKIEDAGETIIDALGLFDPAKEHEKLLNTPDDETTLWPSSDSSKAGKRPIKQPKSPETPLISPAPVAEREEKSPETKVILEEQNEPEQTNALDEKDGEESPRRVDDNEAAGEGDKNEDELNLPSGAARDNHYFPRVSKQHETSEVAKIALSRKLPSGSYDGQFSKGEKIELSPDEKLDIIMTELRDIAINGASDYAKERAKDILGDIKHFFEDMRAREVTALSALDRSQVKKGKQPVVSPMFVEQAVNSIEKTRAEVTRLQGIYGGSVLAKPEDNQSGYYQNIVRIYKDAKRTEEVFARRLAFYAGKTYYAPDQLKELNLFQEELGELTKRNIHPDEIEALKGATENAKIEREQQNELIKIHRGYFSDEWLSYAQAMVIEFYKTEQSKLVGGVIVLSPSDFTQKALTVESQIERVVDSALKSEFGSREDAPKGLRGLIISALYNKMKPYLE